MELYKKFITILDGYTLILGALITFIGKWWFNHITGIETLKRESQLAILRTELESQNQRIQSDLDNTKARVQAAIDRSIFVDKLQFEHEYQIYREVWAILIEFRTATLSLQPLHDYIDSSESEMDRMHKRINNFSNHFIKYRDLVDKNKPFFSPKVYASLICVLNQCYNERVDYEFNDEKRSEYFREAKENRDKIIRPIDDACEIIRNRIDEVKIV